MLGFKSLIFSLFLWLYFTAPLYLDGTLSIFDTQPKITTSFNETNNQALLVKEQLETNRANCTVRVFQATNPVLNETLKLTEAESYASKLTYFKIGNTILLKLNTRTLIFPFHFFT
jgi:hypothetical protein